ALLRPVDLRLLQLVGVIHVDGLPLGVEINRADAPLAMAVAGGLGAAEGQMDFCADGRGIDIGDAGLEVADGGEGFVDVLGVQRRRQPVFDVIGDRDGIFEAVAGDDRNHRPEDFFLRNAHLGIDLGKYGRFDKPAMLVFALVKPMAAADEFSAFGFSDLDVFQVGLELILVHRRTHLDGLVETVADFDVLRTRHEVIDKLGVNAFLHDDAAGGGAALSGGAESAPESAFDGKVEVRIVEHDHRILAAEFERTVLEALGRRGPHDSADLRRARKRDGTDHRMLGQRRADFRAEAGHDVDDAFRDAGIGKRLDQVEGGERSVLRRLDHAGVAADDGGQQLPRRDCHGEIPGRDHAADADRLADGHGELVGQFRVHGRAEEAAAFAGVVVGGVNRFLHVAAGFFEHLAHFAGHVAGVLFFALDQDLGGAEDHLGAAGRGHQTPFGKRALGRIHGCVYVGLIGALEDGDDFASIRGVAVFESPSAGGFDPFAVNEILENLVFGRAAIDYWTGQGIGRHRTSWEHCRPSMLTTGVKTGKRGTGYVSESDPVSGCKWR